MKKQQNAVIGIILQANSNKLISKEKIILHESYCLKHLFRCSKCNEAVEKDEREWHEEEVHGVIECVYCKKEQERHSIEDHYNFCKMRPRPCPYCELELIEAKYPEHVEMCGSKTLECSKCRKFITKKDWTKHLVSGCSISQPVLHL